MARRYWRVVGATDERQEVNGPMDSTQIHILRALAAMLLVLASALWGIAAKRDHDEGDDHDGHAGRPYSIAAIALGVVAASMLLVTAIP